jgi:peptidoglycan/LPS O-acetylase OafA/YrhL
LECFDSLRGLAALAVVIAHLILALWPGVYFRTGPAWDQCPTWLQIIYIFPGKYLVNGHLIVPAFYVISGFVLSLTFFRGGAPSALGSAAARRYLRLMLPVAASILLAYTLLKCGAICNQTAVKVLDGAYGISAQSPPAADLVSSHQWLGTYYNFSPSFLSALREATWGAFTGVAQYNLVLYTMPDELAGSFLVFGFLALFGGARNRWLLYSVVGGVCLLAARLNLLDFVVGMALCDLWRRNQQTWRRVLPLAPALLLIAAAVFLVPGKLRCQAYLVMGAVVASPRLQTLLTARWLTFLGRVSFGLFTLHMPIFCSLGCGMYLLLCRTLGWSQGAAAVTAALISLTATFPAAWVFYHCVDRPTLALTRWLDVRLFRPRPTATTAATPLTAPAPAVAPRPADAAAA